MAEIISLSNLKEGVVAEIVEMEEQFYNVFGIGTGMSIIVLQKAVNWLVQVGYHQIMMNEDNINKIKVKTVNV